MIGIWNYLILLEFIIELINFDSINEALVAFDFRLKAFNFR